MDEVTKGDALLIAAQIGRVPRGRYSIALRCTHGFPQVLLVPPDVEGEPFPTLYWLCCPFLVRAIGRLEADGWIDRLEERVAAEPELRAALDRAHDAYVKERLCRAADVGATAESVERLRGRGIGGIADRGKLKCLHLHAAHALAAANPIGEAVLSLLSETACLREKMICSSLGEGGADP